MAGRPPVIARAGEFLRLAPLRPDYAITSIGGRLDCQHKELGTQLQITIEPENQSSMDRFRCSLWLKSPGWSKHQNHDIVEAWDDGGFWTACIPNYRKYVDENKMLIKYVLFHKSE